MKDNMRLLLEDWFDDEIAHSSLAEMGFSNPKKAHARLQWIVDLLDPIQTRSPFLKSLLASLNQIANPDRVLVYVERFVQQAAQEPALLQASTAEPRHAEMLVSLIAGSTFLAEILLKTPAYFADLVQAQTNPREHRRLQRQSTSTEMHQRAQAAIEGAGSFDAKLNALRQFQRRELLRIGACDLFGLWDLPAVIAHLSHLADSLVRVCLDVVAQQTETMPAHFVVLALGKLGGQELNYSSDIDLLFLSDTNPLSYARLGERLIKALGEMTSEGFLYRVDMRLRPWGRMGPLVSSLAGYLKYLDQHARLWEKQMLLKARVIAGNVLVGTEFLQLIQSHLFATDATTLRTDVYTMKRRIEADLKKRGREWGEVKLGKGSIRDVEFVTQYLQLVHSRDYPQVRSVHTLEALSRLSEAGLLSASSYRILTEGYTFLRVVEHHLQLMHYRQMHTLPHNPTERFELARRLHFEGENATENFLKHYEQHTTAIRTVYAHYLEPASLKPDPSQNLNPHLKRMTPNYAQVFSDEDIAHHMTLIEKLGPKHLVALEAKPLPDDYWQVTIVGFDYLGELSLICGLLLAYGFNIREGHIFTYEPASTERSRTSSRPPRTRYHRRRGSTLGTSSKIPRKIVDVFIVQSINNPIQPGVWPQYTADLQNLVAMLRRGERVKAGGTLAKRVAQAVSLFETQDINLYPVDITMDNDVSERYTVLRIEAPDTMGFLYELTNALSLNDVHIGQVQVESEATRAHDVLYVTDAKGHKITASTQQNELRAAIVLVKHFTHLLPHASNPEAALLQFRTFLSDLFSRPDWPHEMASLERPEVLDALTQLLGISNFLWEDFLRMQYENLFPVLRDAKVLAQTKAKKELSSELMELLVGAGTLEAQRHILNRYKDREMFRIDMRYILGYTDELSQSSAELTDLAEIVVEAALKFSQVALADTYGVPALSDGTPCPICVCALGKAGGRELGFASDIELLFIYEANGQTQKAGQPTSYTNAEFFERLVQTISESIQTKREGIFEIDLRLRPYGRAGSLAISTNTFQQYYTADGPAWPYERQGLVKLRAIAGDVKLGRHIESLRNEILLAIGSFDVAAMRAMRERQVRHLVQPGRLNAKYSPGGLVDVEYLIQGLQISECRHHPDVLQTNTAFAMRALKNIHALTETDYNQLYRALVFLRQLIAGLRIVRGHARDLTLPATDHEAFVFLARRLHYGNDTGRLHTDLMHHMDTVRRLNIDLLEGNGE